MAGRSFTRYYRDPEFRSEVDEQYALADEASVAGEFLTYAVHDPTEPDAVGGLPDGPIIYVGQSKEFHKRIRKRMRDAGTATQRPKDRIDGACYNIMCRGRAPRFTILERTFSRLDSLVSETNWTKRLRARGYRLLNQWTEQKFGGLELDRYSVPHGWLWVFTVTDAIGSNIEMIVHDPASGQEVVVDFDAFPPNTLLRDIRARMKSAGRKARLRVR